LFYRGVRPRHTHWLAKASRLEKREENRTGGTRFTSLSTTFSSVCVLPGKRAEPTHQIPHHACETIKIRLISNHPLDRGAWRTRHSPKLLSIAAGPESPCINVQVQVILRRIISIFFL
jgi:hypothetical protein